MSEAGAAIAVFLAVIAAIGLNVLTLWRLRTPEQRLDAWRGANAQPWLTALNYLLVSGSCVIGGVVCGVVATYFDSTLAWAPVALSVGILASTVITAVVSFRMPANLG